MCRLPSFVVYRHSNIPDWQVNGHLRISPELLQEWLADLGTASAQKTAGWVIDKLSQLSRLSDD